MKTTKLIIVGGFLGAGKTTLLWNVAKKLTTEGLHVGLITNDQAPELVDSKLLSLNDLKVEEVSGSCFCCNFNGFTDAIQKIRTETAADVIIAEPVGSCADLSATIMQPLKQYWNSELQIAPLSVLADAIRLKSILAGENTGLHPDAAYIFRKQLEESDIILINKTDLMHEECAEELKQRTSRAFPEATILTISAADGVGLDEWIEQVTVRRDAGKRLVDMDYDTYANGEAVLGWLNGTVTLQNKHATNWDLFTKNFLSDLSDEFDRNNMTVGHVKIIAENGKQFIIANLTGDSETLSSRGSAGESDRIKLIINARVETSPEQLDRMIRRALDAFNDRFIIEVLAWRYLQPGRPEPTHRFTEIITV